MKKRYLFIIAILFLFMSCDFHGRNLNTFENKTVYDNVVLVIRNNSVIDSFTIAAGAKESYDIVQWDTVFSLKSSKGNLVKKAHYKYEIEPVLPTEYTFTVVNNLSCDVTIKDLNYNDFSLIVTANNSMQFTRSKFNDDPEYAYYILSSYDDNMIPYIDIGGTKYYFNSTITGNRIDIR